MQRAILSCLVAIVVSGCATFSTLTPGSDSSKGVWVAKTTSLFGMQMSDQEILYCTPATDPKAKPMCIRAHGNVHATKTAPVED